MSGKIKIAFLDYSPHYAGAERAMVAILSHLNGNQFEPSIVAPYPCTHHARYREAGSKIFYLNKCIKWWMGRIRWKNPWRGSDFLMRTISGIQLMLFCKRHHIKIIHVNLLRPDSLRWILPAHLAGIKVIGHFRSLPESWIPGKRVQQCCDAIICVSKIVNKHLLQAYRHKHSYVIYDAVNIQKDNTLSKNTAKIKLGFAPNRIIIASIAALFPNKGHDNAIRAFADISKCYPNTDLYIAGGGNPSELERLQMIAAEYPQLSNRVFFSGEQIPDISVVYQAADVVLSLTKEGEAFGLVPLESSLFLTPSIAPNKGAIVEFAKDEYNAFLVETTSVEEITKKLRKILDYPKYANNVSKRLRETVLSQFTPETHARKIEKIYNSVLS